MTEFRKKDLLNNLKEIDDMVTLSLASITFFHRGNGLEDLSHTWMMHFGRVWNLEHLAKELQDEMTKITRLQHFEWVIKKFLLREPFTIISEYCRINDQKQNLERQEWYPLARILRNFSAHGFLNSQKYASKKSSFPISWLNYTITWEEIEEGKIDFKKFDIHLPRKLFEELNQFAEKLPDN